MGLEHVNWPNTSFTNSRAASTIDAGADGIPGSRDDLPFPLPGTRLIHWFRIFDNDPFVVDSTIIHVATYDRQIIDLPSGDGWPASANRAVGESLGLTNTQSVMYSGIARLQTYHSLTADDVNTVKLGMTGVDFTFGTADDYVVVIEYVDDCSTADIEVKYFPFSGGNQNALAFCVADLAPLPTGGLEIHHKIAPAPGKPRILLELNSNIPWEVIFSASFESGDFSEWSSHIP